MLEVISKVVKRECRNSRIQKPRKAQPFVLAMDKQKKPPKGELRSPWRPSILNEANDWDIFVDLPGHQENYVFPSHICVTSLRPDLLLVSETLKRVLIVELTIPAPNNVLDAHHRNSSKYSALAQQIKGYKVEHYDLEV